MNIVLWLTVMEDSSGLDGNGVLWTKDIETGCVPVAGVDDVYLWVDDEDGDCGGPSLTTRRRYMGASGRWHVELAKVVIDPPEYVRQQLMAEFARGHGHEHDIWWTNDNGPWPEEKLTASGWVRYK